MTVQNQYLFGLLKSKVKLPEIQTPATNLRSAEKQFVTELNVAYLQGVLHQQASASKHFLRPDPEEVSICPIIKGPVMKTRAQSNQQFQGNNFTPFS